jgi:hypothetical protein
MDVVIHNHEVPQQKVELLFCFLDEVKEQLFDFGSFESHVAMVDF